MIIDDNELQFFFLCLLCSYGEMILVIVKCITRIVISYVNSEYGVHWSGSESNHHDYADNYICYACGNYWVENYDDADFA